MRRSARWGSSAGVVTGIVVGLSGCTAEPSDRTSGFGGTFPGGISESAGDDADTATGSDDGSEDGTEDGAGTVGGNLADTGEEPGSTSASTFTPLDDDGGDGGGPGGAGDPGWWDFCLSDAECQAGFRCLIAEDMSGGFCSADCGGGDPATCGEPGSGDAAASCITVSGNAVCALDCSGGQTCPDGMSCVPEIDQNGPITICL